MAEAKFKPVAQSVASYIDSIEDDVRRKDCKTLSKMMSRATKARPKMWAGNIVGFGTYHYVYDSGHEGDACLAGFSSRKPDISVYLCPEIPGREAMLKKLGKHRMAKSCLYIRRLSDVDTGVLEALVNASVREGKRRYPAK